MIVYKQVFILGISLDMLRDRRFALTLKQASLSLLAEGAAKLIVGGYAKADSSLGLQLQSSL